MEDRDLIQNRMLESIDDKFDKTRGSFFYDATKPVAIELELRDKDLKELGYKMDIENLNGIELEKFIYQRTGIVRRKATKSNTIVTITGEEGATIEKGGLVSSDMVNFVSLENRTIDSGGETTVSVECEEYGVVGNVPVGAIKYFPVSIPGLVNVINKNAVTNGYNAENDDSLKERYYERIQTPATSGNKYHYSNWSKEVIGVGDARVVPLWNGDNTVKVVIIDSNKQSADEELIESAQEYIDPGARGLGEGQAPIGAFCTVVSATSIDINISVKVTKQEDTTLEQIENDIRNNVIEYLKSIAFKENTISYAKIGSIILDSYGVLDYESLLVNADTSNINITDNEVAILGEVVLSE